MERRDLDSREQVERFVDSFYAVLLKDEVLAPIFIDVAAIELAHHLPHIKNYWAKLLLGDSSYRRHTMNIHRRLHGKRALSEADFQRWLGTFVEVLDAGWEGPRAQKAKRIAAAIAGNMQQSLRISA